MHELNCPSCGKASQHQFSDYLLMCPFCSATFKHDANTGKKEIYDDHFIVANLLDASAVRESALEWLRRLHHRPGAVDKEFIINDVEGFSLPVWVISTEAHTAWRGLVRRYSGPARLNANADERYLSEQGQFSRTYRWSVSARANICETWGLSRLHEPMEPIDVDWDGFPFDSTLSRGRLSEEKQKPNYEARNFFEFKYANGIPILGIEVDETEAIRRAKQHIDHYHSKLSKLNVDFLIDCQNEIEIAGIQLIHIPMWKVTYQYKPKTTLRHFYKGTEKRLILDGYGRGVLHGELAIRQKDKVAINSYVAVGASLVFLLLSLLWHPAFIVVSIFSAFIAAASFHLAAKGKEAEEVMMMPQATESMQSKGVISADIQAS